MLDLGNLLCKYGIKGAAVNIKGNKQAHLCSATDKQVEKCSKENVDRRRFVSDKIWPPGKKIVAWCIDVTFAGWAPA